MTLRPLLIVGAGGHAAACVDVIEQQGRYEVSGLVGADAAGRAAGGMFGYPIVGTDADLPALAARHGNALVCVGQIATPEPRIRLYGELLRAGYAIPSITSPSAYVSPHAALGAGSIVMHGAVVNTRAAVGENCIVNSRALIEHDASIGDHCHVSTAATVNGGVSIGAGTFLGSGSIVREGVSIGERCFIGMGQRVIADCEAGSRLPRKEPS